MLYGHLFCHRHLVSLLISGLEARGYIRGQARGKAGKGGCGGGLGGVALCTINLSLLYKMGKYESLIGVAGILGLISFSSLIQQIYQTRNTASLPWSWIYVNFIGQLLAFIYGVANKSYGIYIPCFIFLLGLVYIFYIKMVHKNIIVVPEKVEKK